MAPDNGQEGLAQADQGIDGSGLALIPKNASFGCALHNLNAAILGLSSVENFACVRIYEFPQTQCWRGFQPFLPYRFGSQVPSSTKALRAGRIRDRRRAPLRVTRRRSRTRFAGRDVVSCGVLGCWG
jgi:hypothetical protein